MTIKIIVWGIAAQNLYDVFSGFFFTESEEYLLDAMEECLKEAKQSKMTSKETSTKSQKRKYLNVEKNEVRKFFCINPSFSKCDLQFLTCIENLPE